MRIIYCLGTNVLYEEIEAKNFIQPHLFVPEWPH